MTDTTERKLTHAMEAFQSIENAVSEREMLAIVRNALARIAALDAPPAPDLAEIGSKAYEKEFYRSDDSTTNRHRRSLMAAYAAMKAADPSCDPMDNPRVREVCQAVHELLLHPSIMPHWDQANIVVRVRTALAALERKP